MPQVGEIAWHVQGDIGGVGVSRFRFTRQDAANISGADVNAAAAASKGIFSAAAPYIPVVVTWTCQPQVNIYDSTSGLVAGPLIISAVPTLVTGTGGTNFSAGTGGRLNWKTSTLSGRRMLKGALFVVPLSAAGFNATGGVAAAAQTAVNGAAAAYLTAMTTAQLYPVVWHRPLKGATAGGLTGIVFGGALASTPAGLRSRRH